MEEAESPLSPLWIRLAEPGIQKRWIYCPNPAANPLTRRCIEKARGKRSGPFGVGLPDHRIEIAGCNQNRVEPCALLIQFFSNQPQIVGVVCGDADEVNSAWSPDLGGANDPGKLFLAGLTPGGPEVHEEKMTSMALALCHKLLGIHQPDLRRGRKL